MKFTWYYYLADAPPDPGTSATKVLYDAGSATPVKGRVTIHLDRTYSGSIVATSVVNPDHEVGNMFPDGAPTIHHDIQ